MKKKNNVLPFAPTEKSLNKKKLSNFVYFAINFLFYTGFNLYFSNIISHKLLNGWQLSTPLFDLVYIKNTGAAFSLLQNSTTFLIILSLIAFLAIFYFVIKDLKTLRMKEILFISFLMSGIFGNLYERMFFGYVIDFFDLTFVNFPIFNISDIFINIGVIGIMILILLSKKQRKNE